MPLALATRPAPHCKLLRLPANAGQSARLAEQAERVLSRSRKRIVKPLDVDHKAFAEALAEAEREHGETLEGTLKVD